MKLLVGLGNPGVKYESTRHNVGFVLVDQIADKHRLGWKTGQFSGEFVKGSVFSREMGLLKPMTFMNLSGRAVAEAVRFFKISPNDVVVIHDDLDMDWGKVKLKMSGGHGGHNGIRSIISELGSDEFARLKVGIGRPRHHENVSSWVLGRLTKEELDDLYSHALVAVEERLLSII